MIVTFQNTKSDLLAFQRYYYSRPPGIFVLILAMFAVPILITAFLSLNLSNGENLFRDPFYYIALLVAECILLFLLPVLYVYQVMRRNPEFSLKHEFELSEEGINLKNINGSFFRTWNSIDKVGMSKHHTFIFVHKRAALIVPHRVFSSSEEREQFQKWIDQYIKK